MSSWHFYFSFLINKRTSGEKFQYIRRRSRCIFGFSKRLTSDTQEIKARGRRVVSICVQRHYHSHDDCTCRKSRIRRVRQRKALLHLRQALDIQVSSRRLLYMLQPSATKFESWIQHKLGADKAIKGIWLMAKLEPKRKMAETSEDPWFVYFRETHSSGVTAVPAITHTPSWTGLRGFADRFAIWFRWNGKEKSKTNAACSHVDVANSWA